MSISSIDIAIINCDIFFYYRFTYICIQIKEDMYNELYEKAGSEIIRELGKRYSDYRKRMRYTQKEVAEKAGLSIFTISSFENGSSTGITLASFIKLLRAIDSLKEIEKLLPELPESPRALFKKQSKK